jgi:hypothetical protein
MCSVPSVVVCPRVLWCQIRHFYQYIYKFKLFTQCLRDFNILTLHFNFKLHETKTQPNYSIPILLQNIKTELQVYGTCNDSLWKTRSCLKSRNDGLIVRLKLVACKVLYHTVVVFGWIIKDIVVMHNGMNKLKINNLSNLPTSLWWFCS